MSNYFLSVGGTGHKVLESMIHLCAAGLGPDELHIAFFDLDSDNRMYQRTVNLLSDYSKIRNNLYGSRPLNDDELIFRTKLSLPFDLGANVTDYTQYSLLQIGDFANLSTLLESTKDHEYTNLLSFFYTKNELTEGLELGFKARPYIGSAFLKGIQDEYGLKTGEIKNETWRRFIDALKRNQGMLKLFVAGSIFGGTGASCFPVIKNMIVEIPGVEKIAEKKFGAFMALPYFQFPTDRDPEDIDTPNNGVKPVEIQNIDYVAKQTLTFYGKTGINSFDDYYLAGEREVRSSCSDIFKNGGGKQYNRPHYLELIGAFAAFNFYDDNQPPEANSSRVFLVKAPKIIHLHDLPYPRSRRYENRKNQILNFTLLSSFMLTFLKVLNGDIQKKSWVNFVNWFTQLKSKYNQVYQTNELLTYFKRYCSWFYHVHDVKQDEGVPHILKLLPNINNFISRKQTEDNSAAFTFEDSILQNIGQKEHIYYNIYTHSEYLNCNLNHRNAFDVIVKNQPNRFNQAYFEKLAKDYPNHLTYAVLNIINKSIEQNKIEPAVDEKERRRSGKQDEEVIPFLPKLDDAFGVNNIILESNVWNSQGNSTLEKIGMNYDTGLDREHEIQIDEDRNVPAIYPVMFARPLLFRDRILNTNIKDDEWKSGLGVLAFSKYFDLDVSVKMIDLQDTPKSFQSIYLEFHPKSNDPYFKEAIHVVYLNKKPFAISFPDSFITILEPDEIDIEGVDWGLSDPADWIYKNIPDKLEAINALDLLRKWLFRIVDVFNNTKISNNWFTSLDKKGSIVQKLNNWIEEINQKIRKLGGIANNDNIQQPSIIFGEESISIFNNKNLLNINTRNLTTRFYTSSADFDNFEFLFQPLIDPPKNSDLFLLPLIPESIVVSEEWKKNKYKILGCIYTNEYRYNRIMKTRDEDRENVGIQKDGNTYIALDNCFTDIIGIGGPFEDHNVISLDLGENGLKAALPFTTEIFNYFSLNHLEELIKCGNLSATMQSDEFGKKTIIVRFKIGIKFSIEKIYNEDTVKEDSHVQLIDFRRNFLVYWPNYEFVDPDKKWTEYLLIHHFVKGDNQSETSTLSFTPFIKNLKTLKADDSITIYSNDEPIRCIELIGSEITGPKKRFGLLGIKYNLSKHSTKTELTYGIDFGSSNTIIYVKEGTNVKPFVFDADSLRVSSINKIKITDLKQIVQFVSPFFIDKANVSQFSTLFYDQLGDSDEPFVTGNIILNENVLTEGTGMRLDKNMKENIKWEKGSNTVRSRYLNQLTAFLLANAFYEGFENIKFKFSFPLSFGDVLTLDYRNQWIDIIKTTAKRYAGFGLVEYDESFSESEANINYLKLPDTRNTQKINFLQNNHHIVIDIGGGSTDIAIAYVDKEEKCSVSSLLYGGGIFADFINKNERRRNGFIDSFESSIKNIRENRDNYKEIIKSLKGSFLDNPKTTMNILFKNHDFTLNTTLNDSHVPLKLFLFTFFSGLMYYIGLLSGSLEKKSAHISDLFIYMCGNGSKLINLLGTEELNERFLSNYLINGFLFAHPQEEEPNIGFYFKNKKEYKSEVAHGLLSNRVFVKEDKKGQKHERINLRSILGEVSKDGIGWDQEIESLAYQNQDFTDKVFDEYKKLLIADMIHNNESTIINNKTIDIYFNEAFNSIKSRMSIRFEKKVQGYVLIEPVFISKLKALLSSFE